MRLLRDHDFRQLWTADLVSQLGTRTALLAVPLLAVITLHATTFEVSLLTAAGTAGSLLFGLHAGAWLDRVRSRPVLIATDLARTALLLSIPAASLLGVLTLTQLYVVAAVMSVLTVFFNVGQQAYLPRLVQRESLVEGNTKLATNASAAAIAGAGIGGLVIQTLGAPIAIGLDAVSYLLSAGGLSRIRKVEPRPHRTATAALHREIGEGLRFVGRHPLLRAMALSTALFVLFQGANNGIMVVFLVHEIHLNAAVIGLLGMVGLLGALVAAAVTGRIAAKLGDAWTMLLAAAAAGGGFLLYPLTGPGWALGWYVVANLFTCFAIITGNIMQTSCRQRLSPPELQGRTGSIMAMLSWGMLPLGSLLGGILASAFGLRGTLVVDGIGAALSIVPLLLSPLRSGRTETTTTAERKPSVGQRHP
jgi:MFS family permease